MSNSTVTDEIIKAAIRRKAIADINGKLDDDYWRRLYAGMAMQGLIVLGNCKSEGEIARYSVYCADALIAKLEDASKESVDPCYSFIVNGRRCSLEGYVITYEKVVELAKGPQSNQDFIWTVTWSHKNAGGELLKGQSVAMKNDMVFSVCDTSNA